MASLILRCYLCGLGLVLLLQGVAAIAYKFIPVELPALWDRALRTDLTHASVHIGWGILLIFLISTSSSNRFLNSIRYWISAKQQTEILGFIFGGFYLSLGFLGIAVRYPLGMMLDRGENLFHLLAGAIAWGLVFYSQISRPRPHFN
ncbi:MAG: hypothetical protein Kow00121_03810 [Elainellaceae cyanobacterium]